MQYACLAWLLKTIQTTITNRFGIYEIREIHTTIAQETESIRAGEALGPLHGVPVTIKLNTDVKSMPNSKGIRLCYRQP